MDRFPNGIRHCFGNIQLRHPDLAAQWPLPGHVTTVQTAGISGLINPNAKRLDDPLFPWDAAGKAWRGSGGATLMTTEIYNARHVLNWTSMDASLGSYEISDVNGRAISF